MKKKLFSLASIVQSIDVPAASVAKTRDELHAYRHPLDVRHPPGGQRVRIDGGDSHTPDELRQYALIATGFGEGDRAAMARRRHVAPLQRGELR